MTTSTNSTRLSSKEACTLAHKIRRETGCSLAEAFKQAYSSNPTASAPLFYTQKDLDKIFSDKVAELINKGYVIYVPAMSGSQGERAYITFIKDNQLYRLAMNTSYRSLGECNFADRIVSITLGKSTRPHEIFKGGTFWKDDVDVLWSFEVAQVANWRRTRYQADRFIPMERLAECEAKAEARIHAKYGPSNTSILPNKFNKAALAWVKTVRGYKGTKLEDIQKVIKNQENGSYNIYFTNKARQTARKSIADKLVKLANLKPTDQFTLQDIESTIMYLQNMDEELKREIKQHPESC